MVIGSIFARDKKKEEFRRDARKQMFIERRKKIVAFQKAKVSKEKGSLKRKKTIASNKRASTRKIFQQERDRITRQKIRAKLTAPAKRKKKIQRRQKNVVDIFSRL